jgi:multidrug efflux pump subunit AcrA (membrane-fusion protein)
MKRFPQLCWAVLAVVLLALAAGPAFAGDLKGKIKSVDPDALEFVIDDNNGRIMTVRMDEDAQVIINDRDAKLADLRPGDEVIVMGRPDRSTMMAVEVRCRRQ